MKLIKILIVLVIFALTVPAFAKGSVINTKAGNTFKIQLESNASTGFQWKLAVPLDEKIVKLVSSDYIAPNTNLVGAGGKEVWVFKAIKKGTTKISLKYVRPWEKIAPVSQKVYTIIVK